MTASPPKPLAPTRATAGLRERLIQLTAAVDAARRVVSHGNPVALDGIEGETEEVCRAISMTSVEQAAALVPMVTLLLDGLERLKEDLILQHARIAEALGGLGDRAKALRAYGTPRAGVR